MVLSAPSKCAPLTKPVYNTVTSSKRRKYDEGWWQNHIHRFNSFCRFMIIRCLDPQFELFNCIVELLWSCAMPHSNYSHSLWCVVLWALLRVAHRLARSIVLDFCWLTLQVPIFVASLSACCADFWSLSSKLLSCACCSCKLSLVNTVHRNYFTKLKFARQLSNLEGYMSAVGTVIPVCIHSNRSTCCFLIVNYRLPF